MKTKEDKVWLRRWVRLHLAAGQVRRGAMSAQEFLRCAGRCVRQEGQHE